MHRPLNSRRYRRKHAPRPRSGTNDFPKLVMTLAAITFLGVYAMLTPENASTAVDQPTWATFGSDASDTADREGDAFYANCAAARAAGAAPMHSGEPGYRAKLDRDSDGVACEPYYRR